MPNNIEKFHSSELWNTDRWQLCFGKNTQTITTSGTGTANWQHRKQMLESHTMR